VKVEPPDRAAVAFVLLGVTAPIALVHDHLTQKLGCHPLSVIDTRAEYDRLSRVPAGTSNSRKVIREIPRANDCLAGSASVRLSREEDRTMKPPTNEALRYAATVLGREVTQLERLLDHAASTPEAQARLQLHELLTQVREVRTWILGVQMPIAQRREAQPLFPLASCDTDERCDTWIHDSSTDEQPHGRECRCSECAAAPIQPADLKLLKTSVIGLIPRSK
jgi:hypothetical protein